MPSTTVPSNDPTSNSATLNATSEGKLLNVHRISWLEQNEAEQIVILEVELKAINRMYLLIVETTKEITLPSDITTQSATDDPDGGIKIQVDAPVDVAAPSTASSDSGRQGICISTSDPFSSS